MTEPETLKEIIQTEAKRRAEKIAVNFDLRKLFGPDANISPSTRIVIYGREPVRRFIIPASIILDLAGLNENIQDFIRDVLPGNIAAQLTERFITSPNAGRINPSSL